VTKSKKGCFKVFKGYVKVLQRQCKVTKFEKGLTKFENGCDKDRGKKVWKALWQSSNKFFTKFEKVQIR